MSLTTAQNATLKAAMLADSNVVALGTQDQKIADYYNAPSATSIWRPNVAASEIVAACVGTEVVALTALKQGLLQFMNQPGVVDATSASVRGNFSAIFAAGATLTALTAVAQRSGTRFETIAGFLTAAAPANTSSVVGHILTDVEVNAARSG